MPCRIEEAVPVPVPVSGSVSAAASHHVHIHVHVHDHGVLSIAELCVNSLVGAQSRALILCFSLLSLSLSLPFPFSTPRHRRAIEPLLLTHVSASVSLSSLESKSVNRLLISTKSSLPEPEVFHSLHSSRSRSTSNASCRLYPGVTSSHFRFLPHSSSAHRSRQQQPHSAPTTSMYRTLSGQLTPNTSTSLSSISPCGPTSYTPPPCDHTCASFSSPCAPCVPAAQPPAASNGKTQ